MDVNFRRKVKNTSKSTRKRHLEVEGHEETPNKQEDTVNIYAKIEELREEMKLQRQSHKKPSKSINSSIKTTKVGLKPSNEPTYGLHHPKDGNTNEKLIRLLEGQFTGQSTQSSKDQHEELMQQYIKDRLQSTTKTQGSQDIIYQNSKDEDALFALPKELQVQNAKKEGNEGAIEHGGALIWNTGIAEVELSNEQNYKTIRATELALERERYKEEKNLIQSSALPTNYSTDFNRHRHDYVSELKALQKDEQKELGFHKVGKHQASDDIAVSRFRKFESKKKWH